jgi:hypothetical protein
MQAQNVSTEHKTFFIQGYPQNAPMGHRNFPKFINAAKITKLSN